MSFEFKEKDIRKLAQVLGVTWKKGNGNFRFEVVNIEQNRKLALEVYPSIKIGKRKGSLISVYTPTSHLQLHFCTGYVVSEMLGEVTFVSESSGKLSGLTVEKEGGCSLYANVDREILSGDFTKLGPEVMLSGIALSLTEAVLPDSSAKLVKGKLKARDHLTFVKSKGMMIANNHPFLRFSRKKTFRTIKSVLRGERRSSVVLSVVFTHHGYMRRLNRQFLRHNYSTDVIVFSVDEDCGFDGEIYVNLDRVRSQARVYGVTYGNETMRLLIHGILHLLGYVDKTKPQKDAMTRKEDYYLEKLGEPA